MENIGFISVLVLISCLFGIGFLMCRDKNWHKEKEYKIESKTEDGTSKS